MDQATDFDDDPLQLVGRDSKSLRPVLELMFFVNFQAFTFAPPCLESSSNMPLFRPDVSCCSHTAET